MKTTKLVTCPSCLGRKLHKVELKRGAGTLTVPCGTCTGSGKVVKY